MFIFWFENSIYSNIYFFTVCFINAIRFICDYFLRLFFDFRFICKVCRIFSIFFEVSIFNYNLFWIIMNIEEIFNSTFDDFDKIFIFRNVSEYIVWKRNMLNRLKTLNFFDYIEKNEIFDLNVKNKKIWKNDNKRIRVIVRMRFDSNAQKIVENKFIIKDIWNIFAVEFKFKEFDHVNFVYETLNNCKLFFFSSVDDYCDKFIELVFKIEAFVFIEDVQLFEIWFIYRFHMNLDFNYQQYCEKYFQTYDVFDENEKVNFFFYVIKRLINVVVVFNNNIFVFVIAFHVCSNIECLHSF